MTYRGGVVDRYEPDEQEPGHQSTWILLFWSLALRCFDNPLEKIVLGVYENGMQPKVNVCEPVSDQSICRLVKLYVLVWSVPGLLALDREDSEDCS